MEDPQNCRRHGERNLAAIRASLERFGQQKPIVVTPDNVVLAGNGTLRAARALGWSHVDVIRSGLDGMERVAYSIADNRTAELAEWDEAGLAQALAALQNDQSIDELVTGFDAKEIQQAIDRAVAGDVVEDEPPPPPANPVTKPGDLWLLGDHRLLCGDSTKAEDVARLLGDRKPFIMVTDPPYGVEHDPSWREEAGVSAYGPQAKGLVSNDDRVDWSTAYQLFGGHVAYVWHAGRFAADLVENLRGAGFEVRTQIIWRKPQIVFGRGHYHWQHEPCWYAVRKGGSSKWCGDRTQSTIWDIKSMHVMGGARNDAENPVTGHSTQKPVECMARPIRNHGGRDDDVYEPFSGSGTTIIAAEQLRRRCYAIEISPAYCDVAVQRWERLTGRKGGRA